MDCDVHWHPGPVTAEIEAEEEAVRGSDVGQMNDAKKEHGTRTAFGNECIDSEMNAYREQRVVRKAAFCEVPSSTSIVAQLS